MTLFWFTEDQIFRDELKAHVPTLKKNTFWNGLCFLLLRCLLNLSLDRRAVQVILVVLCAWELHLAWVLYASQSPSWFMNQPWFGAAYFALIAGAYAIPATSFALSELMMRMIHDAAAGWRDSMMVQLERTAQAARLNGDAANNNGPINAVNETVIAITDGD